MSINSFSTIDGQSCAEISFENVKLDDGCLIASGDEAVFNPLTQLIELKGDPRILAKLPSTRNDGGKYVLAEGGRLFWNQERNRLSGRGDYQIQTLEQAEKW